MRLDPLAGLLQCPLCASGWPGPDGCCSECARDLRSVADLGYPGLVALGYYRGSLHRAVRAYKFGGAVRLSHAFAAGLSRLVRARLWELDVVTHVPLHEARRRRRGFDQAALLAKALAPRLALPFSSLLRRERPTGQQARLTALARRNNVAGAFTAGRRLRGAVLLVDDVFTTGATLASCRASLERAGAEAVYLAVIAVAPRKNSAGITGSPADR